VKNGVALNAPRLRAIDRRVDPEWLDHLAADDPRAVRSRRDLRLMNRIMGHASIIRRVLEQRAVGRPLRIAELGAGDGTLLERVLPKLSRYSTAELVFVDRQPVVSADTISRYAASRCSVSVAAADVFEWLSRQTRSFDAIVANLFLHHFEVPQLRALFALAARSTSSFIACEPRRARIPLAGSRVLGLIGCNDVTRHDAHVSVRAGFSGAELSALWPADGSWRLEERRAGLFSHLFIASHAASSTQSN
jgi:hypothetical protein